MINFHEIEEEVLKFWENKEIFEKLREKNKGKEKWSFIDGPITANNPMGVHHAWGRTYKDVFQRFKAMQGFEQRFQNGFDCQGLWVEREEEKDLGLKNKEDIEKFGILEFVESCKKRVEKFSKIQMEQSIRLGQWMDWKNSYYTMSDENNLHNWHLLKVYFDKGWLYKGKDAVPWCWRCGTASSKHDIATEGYKEVTHKSLFMQFPLKENPDEYFLIFTTTPWTVPANVAIAVNENVEYVKVENNGMKYWLAEKRIEELEGNYKILEKKKGSELEGIEYVMPYGSLEKQKKSPHKVVLWDLASDEEGTGIVHIAPGCGTEDFDLGKKENLPAVSPLDESGVYGEGFGEFSLRKYFDVNKAVLEDLEQRRFVYKIEQIRHRYPHCWRCSEELVFRLVDEWYIKSEEIRSNLIEENENVKWFPEYGKKRQKEWFNNMSDWLISRKRYWGLPLPIWECSCGEFEVFGSLEELKEKAIDKEKVDNLQEIHRPWIDEIKIKCKKCGKEVERIKDVGDAWLDAGIVPFSTLNYLKDKDYWNEWFPADFVCENMPGQYRGWFNALFWAAGTLAEKTPFKAVLGYETLKDEKGEEMHKSKGNAIWFDDAIKEIGADVMRFLYCLQDPANELRFGFNVAKEPRNNLNILYNIYKLIDRSEEVKIEKIEDRWVFSRFNSLIKKVTGELDKLHPHLAMRALQDFWLNDLSRGYVHFVRERISSGDKNAKFVLQEIYLEVLKLLAPMIPFICEDLWQKLRDKGIVKKESVHLSEWPLADENKIDEKLEKTFEDVKKIIEVGLRERDVNQIGLKWPLKSATLIGKIEFDDEVKKIIMKQLNVKEINIDKIEKELNVKIENKLTPELMAEGFAREISRRVQAERKKKGMEKEQKIELIIKISEALKKMIQKHIEFIKERTGAEKIEITDRDIDEFVEFKVRGEEIHFKFNIL